MLKSRLIYDWYKAREARDVPSCSCCFFSSYQHHIQIFPLKKKKIICSLLNLNRHFATFEHQTLQLTQLHLLIRHSICYFQLHCCRHCEFPWHEKVKKKNKKIEQLCEHIPSTSGRLSDGATASAFARRIIVFKTPPSPVKSIVSAMISDLSTCCGKTIFTALNLQNDIQKWIKCFAWRLTQTIWTANAMLTQ